MGLTLPNPLRRRQGDDLEISRSGGERAFAILREVATELASEGVAKVEESTPEDPDWPGYGPWLRVVPLVGAAAPFGVRAGHNCCVFLAGPGWWPEEIPYDRTGKWEKGLRQRIDAVVDGRYIEGIKDVDWLSIRMLTMIFERPRGGPITHTRRVSVPELDTSWRGARRYPPFRPEPE